MVPRIFYEYPDSVSFDISRSLRHNVTESRTGCFAEKYDERCLNHDHFVQIMINVSFMMYGI